MVFIARHDWRLDLVAVTVAAGRVQFVSRLRQCTLGTFCLEEICDSEDDDKANGESLYGSGKNVRPLKTREKQT